jgi:hypothetical protein
MDFKQICFKMENLLNISQQFLGRICIYIYIQGDSGGICTTLENDSMSDSKQKSSYEHVSDFERLRSYGHFLIPVHALM